MTKPNVEAVLEALAPVLATADHGCATCVENICCEANAVLEELGLPWRYFFDDADHEPRVALVPECVAWMLEEQAARLREVRIAEWRAKREDTRGAFKGSGPRGAKLPKRTKKGPEK